MRVDNSSGVRHTYSDLQLSSAAMPIGAAPGRTSLTVPARTGSGAPDVSYSSRAHAPKVTSVDLKAVLIGLSEASLALSDPTLAAMAVDVKDSTELAEGSRKKIDIDRLDRLHDEHKRLENCKKLFKARHSKSLWDIIATVFEAIAAVVAAGASIVSAGASTFGALAAIKSAVGGSVGLGIAVGATSIQAGGALLGQGVAGYKVGAGKVSEQQTERDLDNDKRALQEMKELLSDHLEREQRVVSSIQQMLELKHEANLAGVQG